jgi:hypothetical protein
MEDIGVAFITMVGEFDDIELHDKVEGLQSLSDLGGEMLGPAGLIMARTLSVEGSDSQETDLAVETPLTGHPVGVEQVNVMTAICK